MSEKIDFEIKNNDEEIKFDKFIERLFELDVECNHENYLSEIFIPFFRMCSPDNAKIIPVYDDRSCGPRTDNETEYKKRMKTICAVREDGTYVVPDYIYVPKIYSFLNPCKPYLMVETKKPILLQDGKYYKDLSDTINKNESELLAEISSCGHVIYTDGITWMFLEIEGDRIVESKKYETVSLVDKEGRYYKTNKISIKRDEKYKDIGKGKISVEPEEWNKLKKTITQLVCDKINNNQKN